MMKILRFVYIAFFILAGIQTAQASHLRAGEITARRISLSSATYEVKLITYTDQINGVAANDGQESVFFYFGGAVPPIEVRRRSKVQISASTMVNTYVDTVTFPAPGRYIISCGISNRNKNTINLPQPSDGISFFVQSEILINASFGLNSTPTLLNIPVDSAAVGTRFIHNPGAFDVDGDSLSYKLVICKKDKGDATGIGEEISPFKWPETIGDNPLNEEGNAPATFRIDPRTGDLIWDAPKEIGQYNIAFAIIEWRRGFDGSYLKIGEIVRDMQIIVVETKNKRPKLIVPPDICIEAGETVDFFVTAEDVNTDQKLKITSSGGMYNLDQSGKFVQNVADKAAVLTPTNQLQNVPAKVNFKWETNCQHVRQQEYDVLFKVEDFPDRFETQLADLKTVKIKILPPRPKGLVATETNGITTLTWQPYPMCKATGELIVYRKDGCSGQNTGVCQSGMPVSWGYREIARISLSDTTYTDKTAIKGSIYSYRLVANLTINTFTTMESGPSTEFCIGSTLPERVPVITHVTVEKTAKIEGEIVIKWTRPLKLDTTDYKGSYHYTLYRSVGLNGENFTKIIEIPTSFATTAPDTVFVDKGLNTTDNAYRYYIEFYFQGNRLMGRTPSASSVWLLIAPDDKQTRLRWEANVPWSNDNQTHRVYREVQPNVFNAVADVQVSGSNTYSYIDTGEDKIKEDGDFSISLKNDSTYCYKVKTLGMYEKVPEVGLLQNYSQVFCATPADRSPPCSPILSLAQIDCGSITTEQFCNPLFFQNKLSWRMPETATCRKDLTRYTIYYARYEADSPKRLTSIDGTQPMAYNHQRDSQQGVAGCYYVTATSSLEIESTPSNKICVDNCPKIQFPSIFTPNKDGFNDTFTPMNCPAFIKNADITIYNRYGAKVFAAAGSSIEWDGTNETGQALSAGTYYYIINVQFEQLSAISTNNVFKGWVELVR